MSFVPNNNPLRGTRQGVKLREKRGLYALPAQPPGKCQFIVGESGRKTHWCGQDALEGQAWCMEHRMIVYVLRAT